MKHFENVKFWHKTILPATFEDEVSEYEVLAKLIHKINELIDFMNGLGLGGEIIADRLNTPRLIELSKDVLGQVDFDGSKDVNIETTLNPDILDDIIQQVNDIINALNIEQLIDDKISEIPQYTLPIASEIGLGGVKIGEGLGITDDGTIFVLNQNPPTTVDPTEPKNYFDVSRLAFEYNDDDDTAICLGFIDESDKSIDKDLIIPSVVEKDLKTYNVIGIGKEFNSAFSFCRMKSIEIGEGIKNIKKAFNYNNDFVYDIILPSTLENIENSFNYTTLKDLVIPLNVINIQSSFKPSNKSLVQYQPGEYVGTPSVTFLDNPTVDFGKYGSFGGTPIITQPCIGKWNRVVYSPEQEDIYSSKYGWFKEI